MLPSTAENRGLNRLKELSLLFVLLMISAGVYAFLYEKLFVALQLSEASWLVTAIIFTCQAGMASVQIWFKEKHFPRRNMCKRWKTFLLLGAVHSCSLGFATFSLRHVNYPTNVIIKSCKLLPVMLGSVLLLKKSYGKWDVLGCILMSVGASCFALAGKDLTPNFSFVGISALVASVTADAAMGNIQKRFMNADVNVSISEVSLGSTSSAALIIFTILSITGHLEAYSHLIYNQDGWVWLLIFIASSVSFLSSSIVMMVVKDFDPLTAVSLTTLKKIVSLLVSFAFFAKPFTFQYFWSGALVACGLYLNVISKLRVKQKMTTDSKFHFIA